MWVWGAWKPSREGSQGETSEQREAEVKRHPASSEDHSQNSVAGGKILEGSSSLIEGAKLECQVIFYLCPGHKVNDMMEEKLVRRKFLKPDISPFTFLLYPRGWCLPPSLHWNWSPTKTFSWQKPAWSCLRLHPMSSPWNSPHSVFTNIFWGSFYLSVSISCPSMIYFSSHSKTVGIQWDTLRPSIPLVLQAHLPSILYWRLWNLPVSVALPEPYHAPMKNLTLPVYHSSSSWPLKEPTSISNFLFPLMVCSH